MTPRLSTNNKVAIFFNYCYSFRLPLYSVTILLQKNIKVQEFIQMNVKCHSNVACFPFHGLQHVHLKTAQNVGNLFYSSLSHSS